MGFLVLPSSERKYNVRRCSLCGGNSKRERRKRCRRGKRSEMGVLTTFSLPPRFLNVSSLACTYHNTLRRMLDQLAGRPSPSWRRTQVRLPTSLPSRLLPPTPLDTLTPPRCLHTGLPRPPLLGVPTRTRQAGGSSASLHSSTESPALQVHAVASDPIDLDVRLRYTPCRRHARTQRAGTACSSLLEGLLPVRFLLFLPSVLSRIGWKTVRRCSHSYSAERHGLSPLSTRASPPQWGSSGNGFATSPLSPSPVTTSSLLTKPTRRSAHFPSLPYFLPSDCLLFFSNDLTLFFLTDPQVPRFLHRRDVADNVGEDEQPLHQVRDSKGPSGREGHEEGVSAATEGEQVRVRLDPSYLLSVLSEDSTESSVRASAIR
jgi:hypothetical protein